MERPLTLNVTEKSDTRKSCPNGNNTYMEDLYRYNLNRIMYPRASTKLFSNHTCDLYSFGLVIFVKIN